MCVCKHACVCVCVTNADPRPQRTSTCGITPLKCDCIGCNHLERAGPDSSTGHIRKTLLGASNNPFQNSNPWEIGLAS